jgi:hypothetical protein
MPNRQSSGFQELGWGIEDNSGGYVQHQQPENNYRQPRGIMEMPMQQPQVVYVQPQQFSTEQRAGSRFLRFVAYGALVVGLMDVASIGARNGVNMITHPGRTRDQQVHALFHVNDDDLPFSFATNIKHITGK